MTTARPAPDAPDAAVDAEARAASFVVERAQHPRRVVVAMSGGVDSSVAAWLLKEAGHEVIAVSLRLAPDDGSSLEVRHGRCCSVDDMTDARRVADVLGVPFHAIDARERFRTTVFEPFVEAWKRGLTPIPCLACNHDVKLGDLLETARSLDAALATGHYARKVERAGHAAIVRPADDDRDQTYYLYGTPYDVLADLELPLGGLDKPLVRALAKRAGLPVFSKPDSQEICFVPDGDTAGVVERAGGRGVSGELVHIGSRKKLRAHDGVHRFTVGQRRGTGVSSPNEGERLYVVDVDGDTGQVLMGPREHLACNRVEARPLRLAAPLSTWPEHIHAQVRARHRAQPATWRVEQRTDEAGRAVDVVTVVFAEPVFGVALGQALVCYDGDALLGGGIITGRLDGAVPRTVTSSIALG